MTTIVLLIIVVSNSSPDSQGRLKEGPELPAGQLPAEKTTGSSQQEQRPPSGNFQED